LRQIGCAALIVVLAVVGFLATRVRFVSPAGQGATRALAAPPATPVPQPSATLSMPTLPMPGGTPSTTPPSLAVPVQGVARSSISDSWGDARDGGTRQHHGTDIMAPSGTLVTAAAPGTIEKLFQSNQGGTTLYERSADGGWVYYYAHLSGYAPGVHEGQAVKTGDALGYVGDTGDAGPGNFHLHFGLSQVGPGQKWYQGQDVNPYPFLHGR
jgi:peptidoglycan LD-endopeptidase LytH